MPESKAQRRFMGMVHAVQTGALKAPSAKIVQAAKKIPPSVAAEIGQSKEARLPERKRRKVGPGPGLREAT